MMLSFLLACQTTARIELPPTEKLPEVPSEIQATDVVLILLRGLRADMDTDSAATQAFIDALGKEPSTHYTSAYTQSTSDFVSTSSILTGMYPSAVPMCGLIRAGSAHIPMSDQPWCAKIPEDRYTLPTVLSIYGYRTHLVTTDAYWHSLVTAGFQTEEALNHTGLDQLVASAQNWWAAAADRPRFLTLVADGTLIEESVQGDQSRTRQHYVQNATALGHSLKPLLELPKSDRPLSIYITSLNGVSLMEKTGFDDEMVSDGESDVLLERTLHVPLLHYSDKDHRQDATIVENLDIFPSIIHEIGGQAPANIQGTPLEQSAADPHAYAEFGDMFALRRSDYLLVFRAFLHDHTSLDPDLTTSLKKYSPPLFSLSKISSDPFQTQNLRDSEGRTFQQLYQELQSIREGKAAPPVSTFSPKQLWDLRMTPAQGYW